ncbi:MAG: pitrilysin family protein [Verrucomicrobiota bacterium]|nr:pitrilysin family protein [Verrucomicrobiota bacterium]
MANPAPCPARLLTLSNGLEVILESDNSADVVSVQAWCRTGSIHEGKWLGGGMSHVLEHMLFKGTTRRTGLEIDHSIQGAGGHMNAYTSFDRTVYHVTIPDTGAKLATEVLCDIMQNATLPEDELPGELDVIRREMEMGNDNPSQRSGRRLFEVAYTKSPYRHTVIGYRDIFDKLTRSDLLDYYRQRYSPNNCFFVVTGAIDSDEVLEWISDGYAGQPARPLPPVVLTNEPRQVAAREVIDEGPFEHAHFHFAWHVPDVRHGDIPALEILSTLLGGGRSSRLYREVRDNQALVHSVDAWTYTGEQTGLFGMSAVADADKLDQAKKAMLGELATFKNTLADESELAKAIKQFTAGNLSALKTMEGRAADLGSSWLHAGDLGFSRKQLEAARAVTPEMLQAVAGRYLTLENKTLYALTPTGSKPKQKPRTPTRSITEIEKIELSNGLRLLLKKDSRLPFANFRIGLLGGVLSEAPGNSGLTRLMSRSMLKGTAKRTASAIASEIESAGGSIDAYSGNNSFGLSLDILSDDAALGKAVFLDVLLSPTFDSREIERERMSQLAAIEQQRDHLLSHTLKKLRSLIFGDAGYGLDSLGQAPVVTSLSREQIAGHHNSFTAPTNAVMAVFGDIDTTRICNQIESALAKWDSPAPSIELPETSPLSETKRESVSTEKEQAVVTLGFQGCTLGHADRYAMDLISEALNDMGSRLFLRIREELGLAYYVGTQNFAGRIPGCFTFYAGTASKSAVQVEEELISQAKRLAMEGLTEDELRRAKAKLTGHKKIARQDLGSVAFATCMDELLGLGYNHHAEEDIQIESVSLEQVRDVANRYFGTEQFAIAVSLPSK